MTHKHAFLGFMMILELVLFCALVTLGYYTFVDQSIFDFAVLLGGLWAWRQAGIFLSWRPAEIKAYLNDYQETEKE